MAWNEPGNNGGPDKDPWGNRGGRNQGPPDLDELFNKLSRKLGGFGGRKGKGPSFGGGMAGLGVLALIGIIVWGISGFYTIGEAQRGVVLRFGQYDRVVQPGLNWKPTFVDTVRTVDMESIRSLNSSGLMLTKDENVVNVEMDVQYRVMDAQQYLYSVTNADDSLRQATDSALRAVVGDSVMDDVITRGRQEVRERTQVELNQIIDKYNMGLIVVDVNFQYARPPEQVKDAFDDAIAAREDEARFIREAEAYRNDVLPKATGRAETLKKAALGYKARTVNEAEGEVSQFEKLLPEYIDAPRVTRNRLYIQTMEQVYSSTSKVMVDSQSGNSNLLYLPLDKLMGGAAVGPNQRKETSSSQYGIELEQSSQPKQPESAPRSGSSREGRY